MRTRTTAMFLALSVLLTALVAPTSAQNTGLNRTATALLTNKSGGALAYGDLVVLNNTDANGFTTTTTAGLSTRGLGVILEVGGIANNASGMVAIGGWVPRVNLNTAATVGQFIKSHTVAGQATPHSSPQVEGDFGVALSASATPAAILFGSANGPSAGQIAGLSVLGVTGSATADAAAITASADNQVLTRVSSTSLTFSLPAMVKIQEQTPSGTGVVTFSSLGSYTHLYLVFSARGSQAATETAIQVTLNGDTGANYDGQRTASSTTDALANQVAANYFQPGSISAASAPASYSSGGTLILHDYRGTTFYKTMQYQEAGAVLAASSGNINSRYASGFWRNTGAVTSITITLASGNYDAGSKFTLYGLN